MNEIVPVMYTIPGAGKAYGLARSRIYVMLADRAIDAVKCGRRTLIPAASLDAYIRSLPPATATIRPTAKAA